MNLLTKYRTSAHTLLSDQIVKPFYRFFEKEASSSLLLIVATLLALAWANSGWEDWYNDLLHSNVSIAFGHTVISKSLLHWVNDGLMALFFFAVGLEIKRELLVGELSTARKAIFPVIAAAGGMLVPAAIFAAFNRGTPSAAGWGIPMATDIAFALGAVAIFGSRLPIGLRIFLAAFAIADDLGAVLVIALFYTSEIVWSNLAICCLLVAVLGICNFLWVRSTLFYAILGMLIWIAVLGSGIHATAAGVLVSFFIPARGKYDTDRFVQNVQKRLEAFQCTEQSCGFSILLNQEHLNAVKAMEMDCQNVETPLQRMLHALHPWVAFLVLPIFAFGNAGLGLGEIGFWEAITSRLSLGIILGLFIGKPLGIFLFSYLSIKLKIASLPDGLRWPHIFGASLLGGIGFTMSLFISGLSFSDPMLSNYSKLAILAVSVLSALAGILFLFIYSSRNQGERFPSVKTGL
jgi:NhaA family Na+:H+ antiporter